MNANLLNSAAPRLALVAGILTVSGLVLAAQTSFAANGGLGDQHRIELAQTVVQVPSTGNSITVLPPPRIVDYWLSATRQSGGVVVFDGYVPDDATRKKLSETEGADVNWLKLGGGEPTVYQAALEFGMAAIGHLAEGRLNLRNNTIMLTGVARSPEDYDALMTLLNQHRPEGVVLALREIEAPDAADRAADLAAGVAAVLEQPVSETPSPTDAAAMVEDPVATQVEEPAPAAKEKSASPEINPDYSFSASRLNGAAISLTGQVPAEATLQFLGSLANAPTTSLTIAEGAPDDFIVSAVAGVRALTAMSEGQLSFANGRWSLSGKASDEAGRDTVTADIAALPAGADWALDITMPPALDLCRTSLAEFSSRNAILFQSGAAVVTPESGAAIDELANDLRECPEAMVYIEGHTDADGEAQLNLALSVARAEAVVRALVARDIAASRLYAIGYGESEPIADNETASGKQQNRRIVVSVSDERD